MLTMLLDFFCSRPFPEAPTARGRALAALSALFWVAAALAVGWLWAGDFAIPGENAGALTMLTGALPSAGEAYPLLRWAVRLFCGEAPSMAALNLFGAGVMGVSLALTWLAVRFWALDAMGEGVGVAAARRLSAWAAHVACLLTLFALPGLYAATGVSVGVWCFAWLLLCVTLQNAYALGGGHRAALVPFALVLGVATVESPFVLVCLPIFFLRALAMEWRLWDHSAKNLPLWFVALVVGVLAGVCLNGWRVQEVFSFAGVWATEKAVLLAQLGMLRGFVAGPWLLNLAGAGLVPLLSWIVARRMLDNARSWGLLFTALTLTAATFGLYWGLAPTPWRMWLGIGAMPVATAWVVAVCAGMLIVGWFVQLFARNPNVEEEQERGARIPAGVTACRVAAIFLFPLAVIAAGVTMGTHTLRFLRADRAMADRFAGETIAALKADSGTPAAGRSYLLGSTTSWIDLNLVLVARREHVPLTLFCPSRMGDAAYVAALRRQVETDPLLGDADRLRLTNLLDYNFLVFVQDFFVAQPNAPKIAAVYDLADVWYAAQQRPMPLGTFYVPAPQEGDLPCDALVDGWKALCARWSKTLEPEELPWWDLSAATQRAIRTHLAFMANNLGTFLDDAGRLPEAAACYLYAAETNPENISAKLNLYDICVRRGQIPERRVEVNRVFEDFIRAQSRRHAPRYDLGFIGRRHGYIRNYTLFVNMGWDWAVSAAPESILAGLRSAREALAPGDPRLGSLQTVAAAVYERQGQSRRSYENYEAALRSDPNNADALRGLARLSMQRGNTAEAGKWLSKLEATGKQDAQIDVDRTAYLMAVGDLDGAAKAIGRYTAEHQDSTMGWAMIGMLEMERANAALAKNDAKETDRALERAAGFILDNLRRTAKDNDVYYVHVLEGRIAQIRGERAFARAMDPEAIPSDEARADAAAQARTLWEESRAHYRRAYAIRPSMLGILEYILNLDRRLGDKTSAEADALTILRDDDRNPLANFVVGTQRLEDGHVETAARYFALAMESESERARNVELLNNYADTLTRTGDFAKAKELALNVIRMTPKNYAAWATYALALARNGESGQAQTAYDKSMSLVTEGIADKILPEGFRADPRVGWVKAWIAVARHDRAAAEAARDGVIQALGDAIGPLDQWDIRAVNAAIEQLPR